MGIGFGEVVVCLGATAALFGTKDVPKVARAVGLLTGKAAGYIFRARSSAFKYAQEAQLVELHQEVTSGVRQLQSIQQEVRSGVSFFSNPVAFAASSLARGPAPSPATSSPPAAGTPATAQASTAQGIYHQQPAPSASERPSLQQMARPAPARGEPMSAERGATGPASTHSPATTYFPVGSSAPSALPDGTPIIPVSAVAAGRAPAWTDRVPTGADVMLDSLMEQQVALQAKGFLSNHDAEGLPSDNPSDQPGSQPGGEPDRPPL